MSGPVDAAAVAARADALRGRLAALGRAGVTVVAVTKGRGPGAVAAALGAGLVDVGESYAQELVAKAAALGPVAPAPRWHLVGRLQRNKVRALAPLVSLWQSVDRHELVGELARRAPGAAVLVQVNLAGDPGRGGCAWDEAPGLVELAGAAGLEVRGLMGVAPAGPPAEARPGFARLAALARSLGLGEVSMGMSGDWEVAVGEGATMVRVGRGLFGPLSASPAPGH